MKVAEFKITLNPQLTAYVDALVMTGDAIEHRMHGPIANMLRDAMERR